ncbi:Chalcone-flavanone isomerase [Musa troglodytarum]|uniref:Chalcone--flavanone isomerase n=1 Tax=Musa troglodytarum TaxID=320322 RepID=A0A9E7HFK7_9LILI|nr:Chalcone-flavanone isomerase [Musa troglodytarum]
MGSLRFPFSLPRPPKPPRGSTGATSFRLAAAAVGAGIGFAVGFSLESAADTSGSRRKPWSRASPIWASLSLADGPTGTLVEPRTGAAFPTVLDGGQRLTGIGLRKTSVLGLKNIDVYAFGVYADDSDMKGLREKYGTFSFSELKENKEFISDVLDQDLRMTVRLQIVYNRLSIASVRNAFAKTVGSRIQKFSGSDNRELLQRFTSLFKDEYKLPRGSVIDLSREQGYVLQIKIGGKEVGEIQSKLLCKSVLDLYFGEDPFDKRAKEDIQSGGKNYFDLDHSLLHGCCMTKVARELQDLAELG